MIKKTIIFLFTLFIFNQSSYSIEIKAPSVILQDYLSKEILYEKDADREIYPASMTKIMTSIIAFEMLKNGDLNLDDKFLEEFSTENILRTLETFEVDHIYIIDEETGLYTGSKLDLILVSDFKI